LTVLAEAVELAGLFAAIWTQLLDIFFFVIFVFFAVKFSPHLQSG
jgi:hypothetical protein